MSSRASPARPCLMHIQELEVGPLSGEMTLDAKALWCASQRCGRKSCIAGPQRGICFCFMVREVFDNNFTQLGRLF